MSDELTVPTDVYRIFDSEGALLYVGASLTLARRLGEHRNGKSWWGDVARIEVEHHPSRQAALASEAELIRALAPPHNKQGVPATGVLSVEERAVLEQALHEAATAISVAVTERNEAILGAASAGMSATEIAPHVGLTRQRVWQILRAG